MSEEQKQAESAAEAGSPVGPGQGIAPVAWPPPPATPAPPPLPVAAVRPPGNPLAAGRRYGFLCTYCSSRLEAVESMAGQSGTCPTCGNAIVIPILDYRGRLIDPTSGQVIKQDPHPVHAYAAAGHKAPHIVTVHAQGTVSGDGERGNAVDEQRFIQCPRCGRNNALSSNNCLGCGLPFTMEGTVGDAVSGTNTWAVASLVLGIISIPGCIFFVPALLAVIFGLIALRSKNQATGQTAGQGLAIAGLALGTVGLLLGVLQVTGNLLHM